ncbi:MDR family MFS transporter [Hymenobacter actinosclerus]|uniref:Drug resistance transporter, EmrB/QacA subfamily n=1 Tax=Hymenobacter actinosclerus TaxID=82805 RepID=A0A1I0EQP4_9BACT|nr:MDR family MFS transporter [Hymenobacter actinosclerus]SET47632.1 drug resistance transporter, EmrB/QacA subfamily [Hymenobacter actinosclerus]
MTEQLTQRQKMLTFGAVLLAMFLGALDQTIVSTALPRIVEDLHGLDRFTWVATSYLVASTALVPIYGKLADTYSRRTIEIVAVSVFLLGSALCGLAGEFGTLPLLGDGMTQLIIFRAIQGLGGAGLFAMAFIVIADLFPPAERGRYQGFVGAVFGTSSVLGPFLGGFLTDNGTGWIPGVAGWRLVFYVNLPLGALALWFILTQMPPLRPRAQPKPLDYFSMLLLIIGLGSLVIGLQLNKNEYGWTAPLTLGLLATAALMLLLFVRRSLRHPNPILAFSLFKNPVFRTANAALFLLGGAFLGLIIFEPLFMVNVLGETATSAGVSLIPLSMGVVTGSLLAGQMVSRYGHYKRWMLAGLVVLMGGLALLATMPPTVEYRQVLVYLLICGVGLGPSMPLYTLAIQNAVEPQFIGQATSASQFFRQIGGAIAASVLGVILSLGLSSVLPAAGPAGGVAPSAAAAQAAPVGEGPVVVPAGTPASPELKAAFSKAISQVYLVTLLLVAAGFVMTLFVPELPLRKTNEAGPPPVE